MDLAGPTLCYTRALVTLVILILGPENTLTRGNCVEKGHESLHHLFFCSIAIQARQNAVITGGKVVSILAIAELN